MALSISTELSFINIINSRTFSSRPEEILYALPMSLRIPIVLSPSTMVVAHQSTFCLLHLSILDFSYKWKHTMGGLSAWLFSLSVVFSRVIQFGAYISTSFLSMAMQYSLLHACITSYSFIHQSMDIWAVPTF